MKKYDVIALGELLIDFTDNGMSPQGNTLYEANPGGAPCNMLAMLHKLGHPVSFIGKVGEDQFGYSLKKRLEAIGIDTSNLAFDKQTPTTLAFIHSLPDGDRLFSFYRNPGADMMLTEDDISESEIKASKLFHFGTLSMTHENCRNATKKALKIAKEHGLLISFDPNLREKLWDSLDTAKQQVLYGLNYCDILKISDNEIQWLTGESDYTAGVWKIRETFPIPLILVSMGKSGSRAYYKDIMVEVPPFLMPNTIETTGGGDTFCGCVVDYILKNGLTGLSAKNLKEMLTFANAAAALITTKKGALSVMPDMEEIQKLFE